MKTNPNKYIYFNPTSGNYRVIFTEPVNKKNVMHYYGSYQDIEKARTVRDTILAKTGGRNPFAKGATHGMTDDQVAELYLEKFENEVK